MKMTRSADRKQDKNILTEKTNTGDYLILYIVIKKDKKNITVSLIKADLRLEFNTTRVRSLGLRILSARLSKLSSGSPASLPSPRTRVGGFLATPNYL